MIGEDDGGIVAAARAVADGNWGTVFIPVLAIALRCRNLGGEPAGAATVGDRLLEQLLDRAASKADAAGFPGLAAWTKIDPRNRACARMLERAGGISVDHDGDLEIWDIGVPFADRPT